MSDEHEHTDPLAEDDGRDERLAAALAVPRLDELTRRRLVRTAVEAARPAAPATSRVRWAFAASVAAAMVGGVIAASVALSDGGGDVPTAARSAPIETTAPSTGLPTTGPGDADAASRTPPAGESAPTAANILPDLGDVTDASVLAKRARDAGAQDRAAAAKTGPPCGEVLTGEGFEATELLGRGVQDGTDVLVFRATRAGTPVALTTEASGTCAVRSVIPLAGP